jgi:hypothetical protein
MLPCTKILASAKVFGCAKVLASAKVFGCAKVLASAKVIGCANVLYIFVGTYIFVYFSAFLFSMRQ